MDMVRPEEITQASLASFGNAPDPRMRQISQALVKHLHAFVAEVDPTPREWMGGIEFLTRVGHMCQGARQEFILLSDVLGVSMLVDTMANPGGGNATESTVLGPFYVDNPPVADQCADIAANADGVPLWIDVKVADTAGNPLPGAIVDIWEGGPDGLYDVQRDLAPGEYDLRARFVADDEGRVRCWAKAPVSSPVPADGPVGDLLSATGRHPWRPAHVHFRLEAAGHPPLVTHLFASGDEYLTSDAVFGVKPSLILALKDGDSREIPGGKNVEGPWKIMEHTFVLADA
jgi:hydroxyquinol 1,2-dioxygenase